MMLCVRCSECVHGRKILKTFSKCIFSTFHVHPATAKVSCKDLQFLEDVISEEQEKLLLTFIDSLIKRKRYDKNHFDNVIMNYRETELYAEKLENSPVSIDRTHDTSAT